MWQVKCVQIAHMLSHEAKVCLRVCRNHHLPEIQAKYPAECCWSAVMQQ